MPKEISKLKVGNETYDIKDTIARNAAVMPEKPTFDPNVQYVLAWVLNQEGTDYVMAWVEHDIYENADEKEY